MVKDSICFMILIEHFAGKVQNGEDVVALFSVISSRFLFKSTFFWGLLKTHESKIWGGLVIIKQTPIQHVQLRHLETAKVF